MARTLIDTHGRARRKKSELRLWLDRVVLSALESIRNDHGDLRLNDRNALRTMRKRIAGSISDGLAKKLERLGINFEEVVNGRSEEVRVRQVRDND